MVRKSLSIVFFVYLLIHCAHGDEDKIETKHEEKSVAKRGILHLNIHGHHLHTPTPHLHAAAAPHYHVATAPHFHLNSPHVHHVPIVPKIPVIHRPIVQPLIPSTPYHIHHGGATVTSFNVNYPKYPLVHKAIVPAVFPGFHHHHNHHAFVPQTYHPYSHRVNPHTHIVPHTHSILPHHHHGVYPNFHIVKPLVPIAVPVPKYPVFVHSKPQFVPSFVHPTQSFIPVPIPTEAATPVQINPGSENTPNSCTTSDNLNSQQNSGRITNFMLTRPNQNKFSSPPYNYHAHKNFNDGIDNLEYREMINNFQVTGGHQLAQYLALQHQSQQLIQEPQSIFAYIFI